MPPISPLQSGEVPNSTKLTPITDNPDSASSLHSAVESDHTQLPKNLSDHSPIQTDHLSIEPEQRSSAKTSPHVSEAPQELSSSAPVETTKPVDSFEE